MGSGSRFGTRGGNEAGGSSRGTDVFETSLGIRMELEACLAYLLLPPAGGVILLLFEWKSDYVRYEAIGVQRRNSANGEPCRFHAWQSALAFTAMFVIHLIFSWQAVLSWMLFAFDILLIAFLTFHAYRDGESRTTTTNFIVSTELILLP